MQLYFLFSHRFYIDLQLKLLRLLLGQFWFSKLFLKVSALHIYMQFFLGHAAFRLYPFLNIMLRAQLSFEIMFV